MKISAFKTPYWKQKHFYVAHIKKDKNKKQTACGCKKKSTKTKEKLEEKESKTNNRNTMDEEKVLLI